MVSSQSRKLRQSFVKETVDPEETLLQQRQAWNDAARSSPIANGTTTSHKTFSGINCLQISPCQEIQKSGLVLFAHGGGFTSGSIITHRSWVSHLANATGRQFVLVDYRLLPEHPAHTPVKDFLSVYQHLVNTQNWSPEQIAFGGDSSGAAIAVAAMVNLNTQKIDQPACAFSISGAFDATLSGDSMKTRDAIDPILSFQVLEHWQTQLPESIQLDAPEISPLFSDVSNLAPILLLAGDHEVWLSDSIRLSEKINANGTNASLTIYEEMWHVWPTFVDLPESAKAMEQISAFLDSKLI